MLPTFEGELGEEVAPRCDYRMPPASDCEEGANSGLWLAAVDPDAAAAAPGVASSAQKNAAGAGRSEVTKNASSLGEVFGSRFGGCAVGRSDT